MTLTTMQQRRGIASLWTSVNPTLAAGEIGFETDTGLFKIGDGSTDWAGLPYAGAGTGPPGPGVPTGGSTGQVLTKVSATDYDTDWETPGGGGGGTQSYLGYDTIGGSFVAMTANRVYMKKITVAAKSILSSIDAYVKAPTGDHVSALAVATLSDSGGSPLRIVQYNMTANTSLLLESAASTPVGRWLSVPGGITLPAGDYWIAVMDSSAFPTQIAFDGSGSDRYYTSGGAWFADAGFYSVTTGTDKFSIRANVFTVG